VAFLQFEREQPVGAAEVAPPEGVAGMVRKRGAEDRLDLRPPLQPVGNPQCLRLVQGQPRLERAHAAQHQPGVVRAHAHAERIAALLQRQPRVLRGGGGAEHDVGVAAEVLGRRDDGNVRAERERAIQQARTPGVVGRDQDAALPGEGGDAGQVAHLVHQRAGALQIDEARRRPQPGFDVGRVGGAERALDSVGAQELLGQVPHGLVHAVGQHHVVARLEVGQEDHRRCRQPRGEQAGAVAAFQFRHDVLQREAGRRALGPVGEQALVVAALAHVAVLRQVVVDDRAGAHHRWIYRAHCIDLHLLAGMHDARGGLPTWLFAAPALRHG
jgi:hypothetical protein